MESNQVQQTPVLFLRAWKSQAVVQLSEITAAYHTFPPPVHDLERCPIVLTERYRIIYNIYKLNSNLKHFLNKSLQRTCEISHSWIHVRLTVQRSCRFEASVPKANIYNTLIYPKCLNINPTKYKSKYLSVHRYCDCRVYSFLWEKLRAVNILHFAHITSVNFQSPTVKTLTSWLQCNTGAIYLKDQHQGQTGCSGGHILPPLMFILSC